MGQRPALMSTGPANTEPPSIELRRRAFSIKEAAAILAVSPPSIRRLIKRGLLRPNRSLRHIRISDAEIDRFLAQ
jgi:excisionase family DNA binding protein